MHAPTSLLNLCLVMAASVPVATAQTTDLAPAHTAPAAATSATVVPMLVRYNGVAVRSNNSASATAANMTFLIFKEQQGGEPLWIETQNVATDAAGRYEIYLGSTYTSGLPPALFGTGEARWLEVQIAGETTASRTLLTSVPYALKAADAATLGGLPASAFALVGTTTGLATSKTDGITSDGVSNVTTTGGTNFYLPKFNGASTVVNSQIYDTGTSVGIGNVPNAGVRLDIAGGMIVRGNTIVSRTGNATASKGYPSFGFQFTSNAYNSSTNAGDNPYFLLQSEPTGNNTASPSATFNLLFANDGGTVAETGFYINPNGTVHFAPSQTFPGAGTITGITTTSPLTGSGTSGSVALALNVPSLESTLDSVYPQLAATTNYFTGRSYFEGGINASSNSGGIFAIQGNGTIGGIANASGDAGVQGASTYDGGIGVIGSVTGGPVDGAYPIGVSAHASQGFAVEGISDLPVANYAAILGVNGVESGTYTTVLGYDDISAGVWGDNADFKSGLFAIGVVGTADSSYAGYFQNDSKNYPTIYAYNTSTGTTGSLFRTFLASSVDGACGIGGGGNLTCTGQMKSLVTTPSNGRQVETYAMQSPENWMEDFGSGQLHGGSGTVTLDPVFSETISESSDYHVFLTPRGDSKGLYVTNATARRFEVRESGGGTASIAFDYRIVAKRRGMEVQRLTDVTERLKTEMQAPSQMKRTLLKP